MARKSLFLIVSLFIFSGLVGLVDRRLWKASHGFCLHVIEAPVPSLPDPNPPMTFPKEILSQPFYYLGKGAQSFVFESEDKTTVLKFYRYPSRLRRFPWTRHPFGHFFPSFYQPMKEHSLKRLKLSFHSFFLAAEPLKQETGVIYVHLQPSSNLHHTVHLIDRIGVHYKLPLDSIAFVVQEKGASFLPLFKQKLLQGDYRECKHMLGSLISLITNRCKHNITDLDNMDNDNYGWLNHQAVHLDIGRFQEKEALNDPSEVRKEILRVTAPLAKELQQTSPELYAYFIQQVGAL